MKRIVIAAWTCLAVTGGVAAGYLWGSGSAQAPTEHDNPAIQTVIERVPCQGTGSCEDDLATCEQQLEFASGVISAQIEEKVGTPVPFPDDIPRQYTADGFEAAVRSALAQCDTVGLEIARIDCSEFPCMAYFSQPEGTYNHGAGALRECDGWRSHFNSGGQSNAGFMTDNGYVEYSMLSPYPISVDRDENASTRWSARLEEGRAWLMDEWNGRELTELEDVDRSLAFWREVREERLLEESGTPDTRGIDEIITREESKRAKLLEDGGSGSE